MHWFAAWRGKFALWLVYSKNHASVLFSSSVESSHIVVENLLIRLAFDLNESDLASGRILSFDVYTLCRATHLGQSVPATTR